MKTIACAFTVVALCFGVVAGAAAQGGRGTDDDEAFIKGATESGHAEVTFAGIARKKALHQRVRELAVRLELEHTVVNRELTALAKARGIAIPGPSAEHLTNQRRLDQLNGAAFDRDYVELMVQAHDASIARFSTAVKSQDPGVRGLAEKTLPTLRSHQLEVEKTRKAIGGTKSDRPGL